MAKTFWTPRRRKNGFIGLAVTLLLVILLVFSVNSILAPIIGRKIKNAVIKSSDSLYRLSFRKININIFRGKAELEDLKLIADTSHESGAAQIYTGTAGRLVITGAHPLAYLFHKKLEIGNMTLDNPNLSLTVLKSPREPSKNSQTLYQKLSRSLKLIQVGGIALDHSRLDFSDLSTALPSAYHLKDLRLIATGLLIDSNTQKDTTRTLFCRDITTAIHNFSGSADNGLYHYTLRAAHFSTRSKKLIVRGMVLTPLAAPAFFAKTKADRFNFDLDSMVLDHFNYRTFLSDHFLHVNKLSACQGVIGVFGNPNGQLPKTDRVITFPHYIIRKLNTHFAIDTLDISGFAVSYSEFNKQPAKTGTLTFNATRARFLHISNEASEVKLYPVCSAQLATLFMGYGKLDLSFNFNLADKVYAYSYLGHLAAMPLVAVNPVLMPLALVKIKTGQLRSMDFAISGDQKRSTGTLRLLYSQLDIDLLDQDYHSKVIKTFLAKTLIIKPDNPDQGSDRPRFAKIVFIRPRNYPFFTTLWETLLSGLKPCAGLGYAVKPDPAKPLTKQEQKAEKKALKAALKAKKKADKAYRKKLKGT